MSLNTALAAPQYDKLRSRRYAGRRLLSLCDNTLILSGTITTDLSTPTSWAQFDYTASSGSYADCKDNQVLLMGTANDIKQAALRTRLRGTPSANTITCAENSTNFVPGNYFWVINTYDISYILSRWSASDPSTGEELVNYGLTYKNMLPVVVGLDTGYAAYVNPSTGYLRLGFDVSGSYDAQSGGSIIATLFSFPNAIVRAGSLSAPIVIVDVPYGEQWAQCAVGGTGALVQTRNFIIKAHDPTLYPPSTGYTGGQVSGTLEQGYTMTAPAFRGVDDVLNNTLGMAFRASEQYNGVAGSLYSDGASASIAFKACTTNVATLTTSGTQPFAVGQTVIVAIGDAAFDGTWQIASATGSSFTYAFRTAQTPVATTAASGMAVVNPPHVDFVGWLNIEDDPLQGDPTYSAISTANFTFTGVGPRLARLTAQLLAIYNSSALVEWGQVLNATPWRAIYHFLSRYTTAASLCDIVFDDTSDTYLFSEFSTQGQNALAAVQGIAQQVNALIEFAPWGAIAVNRDATYQSTAARSNLTTVANWTKADALGAPRSIDPNPNIGKVDSDALYYNPTNQQVQGYSTRAPGLAQGEAQGDDTLPSQVLTATASANYALNESKQRVADKFEYDNLSEYLDVTMPGGYVGVPLIPSHAQLYTWTLADVGGTKGVNRTSYTSAVPWLIDSVTSDYAPDPGTFAIHVRYRRLTSVGSPGDDITQHLPAPSSVQPLLPDFGLPAFSFDPPSIIFPDSGVALAAINPAQLLPPPGQAIQGKGQEIFAGSGTVAYLLRNFIALTTPKAQDITPSDLGAYLIKHGIADPFSNFTTQVGGYLLASDGTNSAVWHAPSILPVVPAWAAGATLAGIYQTIRASMLAQSILAYTPNATSGTWSHSIDLTSSDGDFVLTNLTNETPNFDGVWTMGTGWEPTAVTINGSSPTTHVFGVDIDLTLPATAVITSAEMTYNLTKGTFNTSSGNNSVSAYLSGVQQGAQNVNSSTDGNGTGKTITLTGTLTANLIHLQIRTAIYTAGSNGSGAITTLDLAGNGADPFGGGGTAKVQVSYLTDYGATLSATQDVGSTTLTEGGFDVQRSGPNSFAAGKDAVYRATTLGGAYSSYYAITGGTAQAACIVIPYYNWAGNLQTSAANPDIIVGLTAADGSSRTLLWIEGGATAGTVHNLTPVASFLFDNPNAITVAYNSHIAVIGKVSGVYKLYTTNDRGATWVNRGTVTTPTFLRDRRNDTSAASSGTNKGQLYMVEGSPAVIDYSSFWAAGSGSPPDAGMWPRNMPTTDFTWLETIY